MLLFRFNRIQILVDLDFPCGLNCVALAHLERYVVMPSVELFSSIFQNDGYGSLH